MWLGSGNKSTLANVDKDLSETRHKGPVAFSKYIYYVTTIWICERSHFKPTWTTSSSEDSDCQSPLHCWSESARSVVLLLLSCFCPGKKEHRRHLRGRKKVKYEGMVCEYCPNPSATPLRCRGFDFTSSSLSKLLKLLGIRGLCRRWSIRKITDAHERVSRWLWIEQRATWSFFIDMNNSLMLKDQKRSVTPGYGTGSVAWTCLLQWKLTGEQTGPELGHCW